MANHSHGEHHIIPASLLTKTFLILLGLTALTYVTAQYMHLGALTIPVALAIACTKAGYVVANFMGVRFDKPIIKVIVGGIMLFVVIFMTFTLLDTTTRGTVFHEHSVSAYAKNYRDSLNQVPERVKQTEGTLLQVTKADSLAASAKTGVVDSTAVPADSTK